MRRKSLIVLDKTIGKVLSCLPFLGKRMDKKIFVTLKLEPSGKTFRLAVPKRWLFGIAGLLAFFVFSDLIFSVKFIKNSFESRLAAGESGLYASIPYDPSHLVSDLKDQINVVVEQEKRLRQLLGLTKEKPVEVKVLPATGNTEFTDLSTTLEERLALVEKEAVLQENAFEKLSRQFALKLSYLEYVPRSFPVQGSISRGFGLKEDPFTGDLRHHTGVDIVAPYGSPVKAPAAGWVIYSGWESGFGKLVILRHKKGFETYYGHLSFIAVKAGQKVVAGTLLGRVGSTGYSTGPHLHYEVRQWSRPQNPSRFLFSSQ